MFARAGYAEGMRIWVIALALLASFPGWADSQFRIKKMLRTDVPPGKGQCDIRLQVDGEIEASIRGDTVSLRTLSGREARDDGSECSMPMPIRDVRGFNFQVVDSRNEIRLVQPPDPHNNSTATVHIRDADAGYGRYLFRLTWIADAGADSFDHPGIDSRAGDGFIWNNVIHYAGRGSGSAAYNDTDVRRLMDVSLDIDRAGHAILAFRTEKKGSMVLNGMVIDREGDRLKVDAMTEDRRLRGSLYISVNEGAATVRSVDMDGTDGRDRR
jgi:hypothetical protein